MLTHARYIVLIAFAFLCSLDSYSQSRIEYLDAEGEPIDEMQAFFKREFKTEIGPPSIILSVEICFISRYLSRMEK